VRARLQPAAYARHRQALAAVAALLAALLALCALVWCGWFAAAGQLAGRAVGGAVGLMGAENFGIFVLVPALFVGYVQSADA
jgi:hypothetical protein